MKHVLTILGVALLTTTWAAALPQDQTAKPPSQSLADAARKAKAERAQDSRKPVKVFTNDSLPTSGGISVIGPPASEEAADNPGVTDADQALAKRKQEARDESRKLSSSLDLHQRELAVLQQRLNLAQTQFSFNPNETLQQETFRTDINKLTQEVEEKKLHVADDQQAISDLQDEVRREGGDASWLDAGAGSLGGSSGAAPAEKLPKAGTRDYWQRRFETARETLARAQEEQQLAENELSLLQTRQAQELNPTSQSELARAIPAKQEEVQMKRAAAEKAKLDLDTLVKQFEVSGAPPEWSQPEPAAAPPQSP